MRENFVVKHNLKGALFLGSIISASLLMIFMLPKGFALPYIKDVPAICIVVPVLGIGVYITWSNYYLRKIIVEEQKCVYINMIGRRKEFQIDDIGNIAFKDNDNVFIYDNKGNKICKLETNMVNLEEFSEYVDLKKGNIMKCSRDELESKVIQQYKDFTRILQRFFADKEKLGIKLEYGFRIEEIKNGIFYMLKFRAKNENGYLGQNFLKIGFWERQLLFTGYKKERELVLCCKQEQMEHYIEKLYQELRKARKRQNMIKNMNVTPYEMMKEINI